METATPAPAPAPAITRAEILRGRRRATRLRSASIGVTLAIVALWVVFLRPEALGGPTAYVIVSGTSMLPTLESGDLVVARTQDSYAVGDVIVYEVPSAEPGEGTKIVHRVVGRSGGHYIVRGDNREGPDYWRPPADDVVGRMWLHVPWFGNALVFLRQPAGLALVAGLTTLLVALGVFARPNRAARPSALD